MVSLEMPLGAAFPISEFVTSVSRKREHVYGALEAGRERTKLWCQSVCRPPATWCCGMVGLASAFQVLCSNCVTDFTYSPSAGRTIVWSPACRPLPARPWEDLLVHPLQTKSLWAATHQTQPMFQESLCEQSTSQSPFTD